MAITNQERVNKALELLKAGLGPFVERELENKYKTKAHEQAVLFAGEDPQLLKKRPRDWDVAALLKLTHEAWTPVFKATLGPAERALIQELRDTRNKWAHQEAFSSDDAYRAIDTVGRLLNAVSAPEQVAEVEKIRMELLRVTFDERARSERRKGASSLVESAAAANLTPWRDIVTPHKDVASGRYQQAEFAADLWQVHIKEGSDEYRDPVEFFRRTYLTKSLGELLTNAALRLTGKGGDPVVQLQTNFGGGKTHSMLALYHLFSSAPIADLPGVGELLGGTGIKKFTDVKRVVLVGTKQTPGSPSKKPDGVEVRTLWGELAWQLGGKKAYAKVAEDDKNGTSPGDRLRELFNEYGPCLILIDEWVAYARQLHEVSDLPGGSFETQFTFAQALTECAKGAKQTMLVISLPASDTSGSPHTQADDVEVGGQRGREALDRLRNVVGRVESSWRPATAEEGFEIVRRRLFEPITDQKKFVARDNVVRAFSDCYKAQKSEFPAEASESAYEKRMKDAFPIHPEIFDRLYSDWSTLLKFQRTRGVLRLMAAVIHSLWENDDRNPMILPATIPLDDTRVHGELMRYLSDNWGPVIEKDVDGVNSLPRSIDALNTNLGKVAATRRVARTIYLGSAPTAGAANRGLEDRRVKLGCVMPGESPAVFGDALRRLASSATYLYQDGTRYWYSTQPTVTKLADDRTEENRRNPEKVGEELERLLRQALNTRGDFARVHALPASSQEVMDEPSARLVVLAPDKVYAKDGRSAAELAAEEILRWRGNASRTMQNTLVFLAADQSRLTDLEEAVARHLAWQSIVDEGETLNLTQHQSRQAESQATTAQQVVSARLPETYCWLLVPGQSKPDSPVKWDAYKLSGGESLAARASKLLKSKEALIGSLGATSLRLDLDRVPLWSGSHVAVRQLVNYFACYLYLPRLTEPGVLLRAIREGVASRNWALETFAYAERLDGATGRYLGVRAGEPVSVDEDDSGLVVQGTVIRAQQEADVRSSADEPTEGQAAVSAASAMPVVGATGRAKAGATPAKVFKRYHGSVTLEPTRVGRDAGKIADELLSHLVGLVGARVKVTMEIEAVLDAGVPETIMRIVSENGRTLRFISQGFEEE